MLDDQLHQLTARRENGGRVSCAAPVDEKRQCTFHRHGIGVCQLPADFTAVGPCAASRFDPTEAHSGFFGRSRGGLKFRGSIDPGHQARFGVAGDVDESAPWRGREPGIASDDLEIDPRPKGQKRIVRAVLGMVSARDRSDAQQGLDFIHAALQIRGGVEEVVYAVGHH